MDTSPTAREIKSSGTPSSDQALPSVRRNAFLPGIVLGACLFMTSVATLHTKSDVDAIAENDFTGYCMHVQNEVLERLEDHARILLSGAAFFEASDAVTRKKWQIFTQRQDIELHLPGIQGLGFAQLIPQAELATHILAVRSEGFPEYKVYPDGDRELYSSVIFLEPFAGRNLQAFGYDMLTEPVRRSAMEQARDSGKTTLSGKVTLVQETDKDIQAGTLMYVPVYRKGLPAETVEQRRSAILGWVYSPYRMTDLMQGVLGASGLKKDKRLHLQIFDGEQTVPQKLLYACHPSHDDKLWSDVHFSRLTTIEYHGKRWTLLFRQTGGGLSSAEYIRVWLILGAGILISLLLFSLARTLLMSRVKALQMVEERTAELRNSEGKHRLLFENAGDAIFIHNDKGIILAANRLAYERLGYSYAELLGIPASRVDTPEESRNIPDRITKLMEHGSLSFETEHQRKDGTTFPTEVSARIITWDDQPAIMSICRDITERKQAEMQIVNLNNELENRVKERTSELERLNKELEEFCFAISHEFRAPVARLEGFGSMLIEMVGESGNETAHCARRIVAASYRLRNVIDALLNMNRLSRSEVHLFPVNLSLMAEQVIAELLEQNGSRNITIKIAPDAVVQGDRYLLEICLHNLLENAFKYTAKTEDASIEFGKVSRDGSVAYFVKDNGIGFDMEYAKNLFVPFCRLHSEAEFEGTGIGLATVQRIIEKHNGRIWAEAEPGKGATFYFSLGITGGDQ